MNGSFNSSFKLLDISSVSLNESIVEPIDWALCVLCQEEGTGALVEPLKNSAEKKFDGYGTLERNLPQLRSLGKLSRQTPFETLSQGPGIKANLLLNQAVYHKSCFLKCADSKLKRLAKDEAENIRPPSAPLQLHTEETIGNREVCSVCRKPGSRNRPLQEVREKGAESLKNHAARKDDSRTLTFLEKEAVWCHKTCRSSYSYEPPDKRIRIASQSAQENTLSHIVGLMHDARANESEKPVFSMAQITRMYSSDLEEQGVQTSAHSSRLKKKLLEECPFLEASGSAGKKSLIRFKEDVDIKIRAECATKDSSVIHKAADEVRGDIFSHISSGWSEMSAECAKSCVPESLKNLVSLLIDGKEYDGNGDQVVSSISQLIYFHATKKRKGLSTDRRHDVKKETPMPVYLASKLWAETRKKHLVELTYQLGLSISYDRLKNILKERSNAACQQYREDGVVCPLNMELGVFTTGAVDNIDHDTSSTHAKSSFHGTAASLMQHGPRGTARTTPVESPQRRRFLELPGDYTIVPECSLDGKQAACPKTSVSRKDLGNETDPLVQESAWLESCHVNDTLSTWPAFHSKDSASSPHRTRFAILPVFREKSQSMSMMSHSLDIIMKATKLVNPSQVPVVVADQPLFAICKEIQWLNVDQFGEDKVFVMMGALHIEMAATRVLGHWLEGSGWTNALVEAGVTTPGRAEGLVSVNHVSRARYAHQVTAVVLHQLKIKAYADYDGDDPLTFDQWSEEMRSTKPQFRYWDIVFQMELTVLQIVRALRTASFKLFIEAISRMVPFFFALDHQNYARWLPVHIRDLINLETQHPSLWEQFMTGHFVANKCGRRFSQIALDQAHEQLNAHLKGNGGMIGLTEDPEAFLQWMLFAPEVADICTKFESNIFSSKHSHSDLHHFDTHYANSLFLKDKLALEKVFDRAGNPFAEDGVELYNIDTRKCCDPKVIETVMTIEALGQKQYAEFTTERLEQNGGTSIHSRMAKNMLATFAFTPKSSQPLDKTKQQLKLLKQDANLFSHMWVATTNHQPADLEEFFNHENQEFPPALSTAEGTLRSTAKEVLVNKCLAPLATSEPDRAPPVDAKVLDGPALAHLLSPGLCLVFSEYVEKVFLPFIRRESHTVSRLDVIFDVYRDDSLKGMTREKRGEGPRLRVASDTKIPKGKNWQLFLRNSENKDEFFKLLADAVPTCLLDGVELYATRANGVVSNCSRQNMRSIAPCNHEEADTRIFVHVADAVRRGATKVLIRASDTDVIALAISFVHQLPQLRELWVHRPTSKDNKYIPIHEICSALGPEVSLCIPPFHAFTGCDTVDAFKGIGKKAAWNALKLQPTSVQALIKLSEGKIEEVKDDLEKFVIAMYSPAKQFGSVNRCRRGLFSASNRLLESIPPTSDALGQHMLRAAYQAQIWRQLSVHQDVPDPTKWGWMASGDRWVPRWMTLQPKSDQTNVILVRCKCKTPCRGNCSCSSNKKPCTDLCSCLCNQ